MKNLPDNTLFFPPYLIEKWRMIVSNLVEQTLAFTVICSVDNERFLVFLAEYQSRFIDFNSSGEDFL